MKYSLKSRVTNLYIYQLVKKSVYNLLFFKIFLEYKTKKKKRYKI